jgi:hypothetical protein
VCRTDLGEDGRGDIDPDRLGGLDLEKESFLQGEVILLTCLCGCINAAVESKGRLGAEGNLTLT